MALALTFVQSNNGKTLTVTDDSTVGTNMTGITMTITWDSVVYNITLTAWAVGSSVEVTADDVGQTADTAFLDGVYTVDYSNDAVGDDDVQYNVLLYYNVRYCVYDLYRQLPDIHACVDLCSNKQVERTLFMGTYLRALEYSAACGQVNEINTILATLQNLCLNPGINECYCN
jgi:hypothetical protein